MTVRAVVERFDYDAGEWVRVTKPIPKAEARERMERLKCQGETVQIQLALSTDGDTTDDPLDD